MIQPELELLYESSGRLGDPIELGRMPDGLRRVIPIRDGSIGGPRIFGKVLPGSAD